MRLSEQLKRLEGTGQIRPHIPTADEVAQHIHMAKSLLCDARRKENSLAGRFDIGNSAGHALLMAAIKMHGYRPTGERGHRAVLYQLLDVLLPAAAGAKDTLSRVHNLRNRAEYDGDAIDITQGLIDDLVDAVENVREEVSLMFKRFEQSR